MRFHDRCLLGETGTHRSVPRKGRAMDRLEAMSIVLAVAEAGSLSAAARRLNTPPATASRKITELEGHLRAKLFDRSARKLTLTDFGPVLRRGAEADSRRSLGGRPRCRRRVHRTDRRVDR